ncbi:MAG: F0F1 ATP synthase subunit A, partial [Butyrivibrio sp.]|nr:F0F1 ATP synthase subunit A [Butyrivibrio sp.]
MKELLVELLMEDKTLIHVPFGNGFFDINKSVVVTWGILVLVTLLVILLTSGLKVHNISRRQAAVEAAVLWLREVVGGMLGEEAASYTDYIITVLIFIGISNMVGLFGFTPPTMDLNVTVALAVMSIILVELAGILKKGPGGWLKSFASPMAVILPMNIL